MKVPVEVWNRVMPNYGILTAVTSDPQKMTDAEAVQYVPKIADKLEVQAIIDTPEQSEQVTTNTKSTKSTKTETKVETKTEVVDPVEPATEEQTEVEVEPAE